MNTQPNYKLKLMLLRKQIQQAKVKEKGFDYGCL